MSDTTFELNARAAQDEAAKKMAEEALANIKRVGNKVESVADRIELKDEQLKQAELKEENQEEAAADQEAAAEVAAAEVEAYIEEEQAEEAKEERQEERQEKVADRLEEAVKEHAEEALPSSGVVKEARDKYAEQLCADKQMKELIDQYAPKPEHENIATLKPKGA